MPFEEKMDALNRKVPSQEEVTKMREERDAGRTSSADSDSRSTHHIVSPHSSGA